METLEADGYKIDSYLGLDEIGSLSSIMIFIINYLFNPINNTFFFVDLI